VYKSETELCGVVVTISLIPPKEIERVAVHDACHYLWKYCIGHFPGKGSLDSINGPGFDSIVDVDMGYDSIEKFQKHHALDEELLRAQFEEEILEGMKRYYERKLLDIIISDLDEHTFLAHGYTPIESEEMGPVVEDMLSMEERRDDIQPEGLF